MKWNAYYYNSNQNKIQSFNIFDHWRFSADVKEDLDTYINKDEFAKALRSNLFYYFCSKCEWEILISPWIANSNSGATIKIDIYDQVMQNFEQFCSYVWSFAKRTEEADERKENTSDQRGAETQEEI